MAECADPILRSFTVNVGYVSLSIGVLLGFALGTFLHWRTIAWVCIVLPAITLFSIAFIPETPVWLVRNGNIEKALKSLTWLRGNEILATKEFGKLSTRFDDEKSLEWQQSEQAQTFWKICTEKGVYRPTIIVFLFIIFFNLSGTYLIVIYAVDIVNDLQLPLIDKSTGTVILSAIRLAVTVLFCWLFIHVQRRKIYLLAGIGSTLSTAALAFYIFGDFSKALDPATDVCIKGALMAMYVATNTGFQITPGFMIGELLPAKVRGRVAGYLYTVFSIVIFIIAKMFPSMRNQIGIDGILVVWALASLSATMLIYFTIPETKGKSLEEIEDYFRYGGWIYRLRNNDNNGEYKGTAQQCT